MSLATKKPVWAIMRDIHVAVSESHQLRETCARLGKTHMPSMPQSSRYLTQSEMNRARRDALVTKPKCPFWLYVQPPILRMVLRVRFCFFSTAIVCEHMQLERASTSGRTHSTPA